RIQSAAPWSILRIASPRNRASARITVRLPSRFPTMRERPSWSPIRHASAYSTLTALGDPLIRIVDPPRKTHAIEGPVGEPTSDILIGQPAPPAELERLIEIN